MKLRYRKHGGRWGHRPSDGRLARSYRKRARQIRRAWAMYQASKCSPWIDWNGWLKGQRAWTLPNGSSIVMLGVEDEEHVRG